MRSELCILVTLTLLNSFTFAENKSFEFDDLTPIPINKPKIDIIQPKAATPNKDENKEEASNPLPQEKSEPKSFFDKPTPPEKSKIDLYAEPIKEKVAEKLNLFAPAVKEPVKEQKKINLTPEKPFPIPQQNKETSVAKLENKELSEPKKASDDLPEPRPLGDLSTEEKSIPFADSSNSNWMLALIMLFFTGLMFLYFWYQKFLRGKMQTHGVDIQILGQTFLDGQTKIVLLKVGAKVIVMAKSPNFCTTLDIITEPEQINLLTLGSSAAATGEDFSSVLNDLQSQPGAKASSNRKIPNEREMRTELDQLKQQLGKIQNEA